MTNNSNIKKHRLSGGFDPKAYRFVESFDNRSPSIFDGDAIDPLPVEVAESVKVNGYSLDHCTHCGAALLSGAVYQHDSGEHIIIGTTCSGRLDFESAGEIQAAHQANRMYLAGLRKAIRKSERWSVEIRFLEAARDDESMGDWERGIAEDMLRKLSKYGSLSNRQIEFIHRIVREYPEKEAKRKAREAADAASKATAPDWESGRYPIEGTVLGIKYVDTAWGYAIKCLIELEDGRRCWGSVPSSLDVDKGDAIAITATFSPSRDDSKFAFFKRPTATKVEA
tara:strand:+ start:800 stop:1645 length:846 start_codon:yes stop_codon:yes gene_type:complete